jgi:hypothetical protein
VRSRAEELAAVANMGMQAADITIGLETSPVNLHGLSHREWGDATDALAVLMETTNPAQGRLRGAISAALVTGGADRFYARAAARGRLAAAWPPEGWPLGVRVARHLATIRGLVATLPLIAPDAPFEVEDVPAYSDLAARGLGAFLQPPPPDRSTRP